MGKEQQDARDWHALSKEAALAALEALRRGAPWGARAFGVGRGGARPREIPRTGRRSAARWMDAAAFPL